MIDISLLWLMVKVSLAVFAGGFLYCWGIWELCEWDYKRNKK